VAEPGEDSASTRDAVAAARALTRARGSTAIRAAIVISVAGLAAADASAQPASSEPAPTAPAPDPTAESLLRRIEIHGFASEGAFVQTANDYFGSTSRASLELFEAGINVSTEVTDRLRVGLQYIDIDAARLPILLPSSVYPIRNRDVLLSHTGFAVHGDRAIGYLPLDADAGGAKLVKVK